MRLHAAKLGAALATIALASACRSGRPQAPRVPPAADLTWPVEGAIRGVAGNGTSVFALVAVTNRPADRPADSAADSTVSSPGASELRALRGGKQVWRTELAGTAAPAVAVAGPLVAAVLSVRGDDVRGDPAATVVAVDAETGAKRWSALFDSTGYAVITSIASLGDDFVVGGLFGGTLRAKQRVVTSAGGSDGFVARVTKTGDIAWLVRTGGVGADGIQGVATRERRIAVAGTFSTGAELAGIPLTRYDERLPYADAFAVELDERGARLWSQTFGGRGDDSVAGVTIDALGNVVVAASAREVVHVGSTQLVTQGEGDGVLVWLGPGGDHGASILVGGTDFDGIRDITSAGDKTIVGGFFSGSLKLGDRTLTAGGGDDAFIAAFDASGTLATSWHVGGDGREEITSLDAIPGGIVAGIAHTASAAVDDTKLASPKDPLSGSAVVARGVR